MLRSAMSLNFEKYKKRLIEEREQLTEQIGTVQEVSEPTLDDRQITAANAPVIGEIKDTQNRIVDMRSGRLKQVNAALRRIENGAYGTCEVCDQQIDERRLDAEPAATTCINHARQKDGDIETPSL
jgi:RNA polymerase-binding transcription factor DksA